MRKKSLKEYAVERKKKELSRLLAELESSVVLVEGKKDRRELERVGCKKIFTLSGGIEKTCRKMEEEGVREGVILTDLDRKGEELTRRVEDALSAHGIRANLYFRARLGALLHLRNFENLGKKIEKMKGE